MESPKSLPQAGRRQWSLESSRITEEPLRFVRRDVTPNETRPERTPRRREVTQVTQVFMRWFGPDQLDVARSSDELTVADGIAKKASAARNAILAASAKAPG
ncbi:hypothetical protein, partial [Streptomyces mirabilis]|uniref:hypothetical protein n=1 Tax=Streptomyces mirabilis TaxID=68239 RepID=UPI003829C919